MKKLLTLALTGLLAVGAVTPSLAFGPLDIDAELPYYSKYVWRGQLEVDDPVLQPSLDVSLLGFELVLWGNMDLTDANGMKGTFSEIDYSLGYELELPLIEFGLGFIHYSYPKHEVEGFELRAGEPTTEFYLGAEANVLLSPQLTFYQDIDKFKGGYWEAGVEHGVTLGETMKLVLSGGLGLGSKSYMIGYFGVDPDIVPDVESFTSASMTDYHLGAELPYNPLPTLTLFANVKYTALLGDAKDAVAGSMETRYGGKTDNTVFGLGGRFSF